MKKLITIIMILFLASNCATMKTAYEKGRTGSYDKRTKLEKQQDQEHYWAHKRQYEQHKKERYGK